VRRLVVESTQLAKAKAAPLAAAQQTAQDTLAALYQPRQRRWFACEAEAPQAASLGRRELALRDQVLTDTVAAAGGPDTQATRGRSPQHAPRPQRQVWRVTRQGRAASQGLTAQARRERRFGLATNGLDVQPRSDAALARADQEQPAAESRCKWAKSPAALAPLFLETPTRMAAWGGVHVLALLGYPLVERHVRKALVERGDPLPDRPAPSPCPTARTVSQLRRTMALVTLRWAGQCRRHVTTLKAHQLHGLGLLGDGEVIDTGPHRNSGSLRGNSRMSAGALPASVVS
jgi:hypothetical protein